MWGHQEHPFQVRVDWFEDKQHFDDCTNVEQEFLLLYISVQLHHLLRKFSQSQGTTEQILQEGKCPVHE